MKYKFFCRGHRNIIGDHRTTLEFTKDKDLTIRGNCIIGINADFELEEIRKLLEFDKLKITITVNGCSDEIICSINREFDDNNEIVIRMGKFISRRTLGICADKASRYLKREIIKNMKEPESIMEVNMESI